MNSLEARVVAGTALAVAGLLQLVGDTVYAIDRVYPGDPGFAFANLTAALWHTLILASLGVLFAVTGRAAGTLARTGLAVAAAGIATLIAAEIMTQLTAAIPVPLIAASAPVTGVGMVLAGAGFLRAGASFRSIGITAVLAGAYALAIIIPTSLGVGGANYFVIAGWGLLWAGFGAAVVLSAPRPAVKMSYA